MGTLNPATWMGTQIKIEGITGDMVSIVTHLNRGRLTSAASYRKLELRLCYDFFRSPCLPLVSPPPMTTVYKKSMVSSPSPSHSHLR
ncbi:hypothetical protein L1987_13903 [Smallanthus sonchifolius]|uniref:Uncharacterized protein n=1 Tax=Smallanthus sonchifolius TaxID=185202 RepID=A0ACB9JLA7_9ASTR|nr:hypothetical protein L1987_13903 [Smallanthus sonchifolius]